MTPKQRLQQEQDQEGLKERLEREHSELLDELRALIPGAEVLFGFLLAIRFTSQFKDLTTGQQHVYFVTLLATGIALVLFLAPAAYHRIRFREGDKEVMLRKGNREVVVGSFAIALALTGVILIVTDLLYSFGVAIAVSTGFFALIIWRWWALAFYRQATE